MDDFEPDEVIITSNNNCVSIYDANGTKVYKNYKINSVGPNCLALLGGEYFISGSTKIPEIKIWNVKDERKLEKNPCGLVSALTTTACGTYCVAAFNSKIQIWNVQSGEMLSAFERHYQDVTCLRFTHDDSYFISGGKDGLVMVWLFSKMISVTTKLEQVQPIYTWNNHTKAVTDIFGGTLGDFSRIVTASLDLTCRIYEIDSAGMLLCTICLDVVPTSVIMDPLENFVIIGTQKGTIEKINLYYEMPKELHSNTATKEEQIAHKEAIACLSLSCVGDKFLSASVDGTMKLWETATLNPLSVIKTNHGAFTNAFYAMCPYLLLNNLETTIMLRPLQRNFISRDQTNPLSFSHPLKLCDKELEQDYAESLIESVPNPLLGGYSEPKVLTAEEANKKEDLFQQVLKDETLSEVRDINNQMYTYMLEHALSSMGNIKNNH